MSQTLRDRRFRRTQCGTLEFPCSNDDVGDGECQLNCFRDACDLDDGDCSFAVDLPNCAEECKVGFGNGDCDENPLCNNETCNFDGLDCKISGLSLRNALAYAIYLGLAIYLCYGAVKYYIYHKRQMAEMKIMYNNIPDSVHSEHDSDYDDDDSEYDSDDSQEEAKPQNNQDIPQATHSPDNSHNTPVSTTNIQYNPYTQTQATTPTAVPITVVPVTTLPQQQPQVPTVVMAERIQ